jgi:chemotaxis protein CheX
MNPTSESLPKNSAIRQDWIPLLEAAAREVFEMMLGCKLTEGEGLTQEPLAITSMVGMAGKLRGVLVVRCSHTSGALIASKMLGLAPEEIGSQLIDAMGEIANMIAGNFKHKIPGLDDGCMLTVPTVIMGNDYNLQSLTAFETLELRPLFENQPIAISLAIHSRPSSPVRPRP